MQTRRRSSSSPVARLCAVLLPVALFHASSRAQDAVPLTATPDALAAWKFNNGQEFPGATGSLTVDQDVRRENRPSLKLVGDFTKGGMYVQAGRKVDRVDVREIAAWVRNPGSDRFTLRLTDGSGQAHQFSVRTEPGDGWQRVVLPIDHFFERRGRADAPTGVAKYDYWGGAKDGQWHGPATGIYFITGKPTRGGDDASKVRTFWLNDVTLTARASAAAVAETRTSVRLDQVSDGEHGWTVSLGGEVPGAKGSLAVAKDEPATGQTALKLSGDFTGGGAYVAAIRDLKGLVTGDVSSFRMKAKTDNAASITVQLVDATGQTHQRKGVKLTPDGQWHELTLTPKEIAGGEHWGGAKDGKWHNPPTRLVLSVTAGSDKAKKQPVVYLADVRAEALTPVFAQPAAFKADFDRGAKLDDGWVSSGKVSVDPTGAFKNTAGALLLSRALEDIDKPCTVTGPTFPAGPGQWQVGVAVRSDLNSPDNSYSGTAHLDALDAAGKVLESFPLADVFGRRDWQPITKRVDLPKGTAAARFRAQLNKAHGKLWLDDVSASYLAPAQQRDDRIARVLFSTAALGNLLLPEDPRTVSITVEATKPLGDDQRALSYVVRDYWGAEQTKPATVSLAATPEKKAGKLLYNGSIDLRDAPLEVGRYYELHASVPQPGGEPFTNHTSLAILPPAVTKQYKPEDVPFTSRNWDNRSTEYIRLSDRLGIRVVGIWGGWSSKAPYAAEAPRLELAKELGLGWLTTTPASTIERGKTDYDETALRQGVRNLIEKFGQHRPFYINLGNEPHGTGDKVLRNVAAYKAIYEEVKKVDPTIPVIATSVEPNEEYFKAGYGQWCDAFDFHIYEGPEDVRRTIGQYKALMKKYDVEKPIWSTELGLNSQGVTRHVVAQEVTKKFATFFAAGGARACWFALVYPDADGKSSGSSGDSHNVFDSRFNRYCPRLDAVAYYNAVNAIAVKKFVAERQYPAEGEGGGRGVRAFLFRDKENRTLQVLWRDEGRQDATVPLPGVRDVQVIRVDGSRRALNADGKGVTLSLTADPLLLLYEGGPATLPDALGEPAATLEGLSPTASRGRPVTFSVALKGAKADDVNVVAPAFWTVAKAPGAGQAPVAFTLTPPADTAAHHADFTVTLGTDATRVGELYYRTPLAD